MDKKKKVHPMDADLCRDLYGGNGALVYLVEHCAARALKEAHVARVERLLEAPDLFSPRGAPLVRFLVRLLQRACAVPAVAAAFDPPLEFLELAARSLTACGSAVYRRLIERHVQTYLHVYALALEQPSALRKVRNRRLANLLVGIAWEAHGGLPRFGSEPPKEEDRATASSPRQVHFFFY
jgi:hypothetical protein